MRSGLIALILSLAFSLLGWSATQAAAQDPPDTSVADAARRAQQQKKPASKPAKVITNDTLPAARQQASTTLAGTPPPPSPDAAAQPARSTEAAPATTEPTASPGTASSDTASAAAADTAGASTATETKATAGQPANAAEADKAQTNPEVIWLKQQIAEQQKEVELLLRLHALDQDAFLSNPDHAKDPQGKAKLDAQQEEIHAKVSEVAHLKAKLASIAPGESAKVGAPKP